MDRLFGTKKQPEEQKAPQPKQLNQMSKDELKESEKEFKRKLNKEIREIDREIFKIEQLKKQSEQNLQKEIRKGDKADKFIKQTYAKQVCQCNTNRNRYMMNKAKVQNLSYTLDTFYSNIKMAKVINASNDIMKGINQCMNIKEMNITMAEMQKEMMKMGMIQEMMNDAMESVNDEQDIDNEEEVDKIIQDMEIKMKQPSNPIINPSIPNQPLVQENQDDFDKQLAALKN